MKHIQDNNQKTTTHKPGEMLKDKIHLHLRDENDIITEEDIRDFLISHKTPEEDFTEPKKKAK